MSDRVYIGQRAQRSAPRRGIVPLRGWDDGSEPIYLGALEGVDDIGSDPAPRRRPVFLENPIDLASDEVQRRGGILLRIRPELTPNVAAVSSRTLDLAQGLLGTMQWALVAAFVLALAAGVAAVWWGTGGANRAKRS